MKEQNNEVKAKSFLEAEADGIIEGRNAVIEALRAGAAIDKIYLAKGDGQDSGPHRLQSPCRRHRGGGS